MNCLPPIFRLRQLYPRKKLFPKKFHSAESKFSDRSTPSIVFEAGENLITNPVLPRPSGVHAPRRFP